MYCYVIMCYVIKIKCLPNRMKHVIGHDLLSIRVGNLVDLHSSHRSLMPPNGISVNKFILVGFFISWEVHSNIKPRYIPRLNEWYMTKRYSEICILWHLNRYVFRHFENRNGEFFKWKILLLITAFGLGFGFSGSTFKQLNMIADLWFIA